MLASLSLDHARGGPVVPVEEIEPALPFLSQLKTLLKAACMGSCACVP